jgi:hypothetical protein
MVVSSTCISHLIAKDIPALPNLKGRYAPFVLNFRQIKQLSKTKIGAEATFLYVASEKKCQFWHSNPAATPTWQAAAHTPTPVRIEFFLLSRQRIWYKYGSWSSVSAAFFEGGISCTPD